MLALSNGSKKTMEMGGRRSGIKEEKKKERKPDRSSPQQGEIAGFPKKEKAPRAKRRRKHPEVRGSPSKKRLHQQRKRGEVAHLAPRG